MGFFFIIGNLAYDRIEILAQFDKRLKAVRSVEASDAMRRIFARVFFRMRQRRLL